MKVRQVAVDQAGRFVSDMAQQGNILTIKKTRHPERALEMTDTRARTIQDWQGRAAKYGDFDYIQVINLEVAAV